MLTPRRAQMITTAVAVSTDGAVVLGAAPTYGILLAILLVHGLICSAATRILARINLFYGLLTGMFLPGPRAAMLSADYIYCLA